MIHNTHMSQYIPPTAMHYVTGTWTDAAGAVTDTICKHKAAGAETAVVNIPIIIPSNSVALQGAKLESVEVDYEQLLAGTTSTTFVLNKVTRGANGAVAVVSVPTVTCDIDATERKSNDQHRAKVSITTPEWADNDVYYLLEATFICGGTVTLDILAAVANFTLRA